MGFLGAPCEPLCGVAWVSLRLYPRLSLIKTIVVLVVVVVIIVVVVVVVVVVVLVLVIPCLNQKRVLTARALTVRSFRLTRRCPRCSN